MPEPGDSERSARLREAAHELLGDAVPPPAGTARGSLVNEADRADGDDDNDPGFHVARSALMGDRPARGAAAVVVRGFLLLLEDHLEERTSQVRMRELGGRLERGTLPSPAEVLAISESELHGTPRQVIADFVSFLLDSRGPDQLIAFTNAVVESHPDLAAEYVLGAALPDLEKEWAARLAIPPSEGFGMLGFVKRSMRYVRPYWKIQALVLAATLVTTAFTVLLPLSFKVVIDEAIGPRRLDTLGLVMVGLFLLFVLNSAASLGREYLAAKISVRVLNDLRAAMFERLQKLSGTFYARADTGDVMSRASSDLMVVDDAISQLLPMALSLLLSLVFSTAVLFTLEWRLALAALLPLPIFVIGPLLFGPRAGRASLQLQQDTAAVATSVQENLSAQAVVKAYGLQEHTTTDFRRQLDRLERSTLRARLLGSAMGATGEFGMSLIQLLILGGGGYLVIKGQLALGSLVAFQALIGNVAAPLFSLSDLSQMLQQATGGLRRVEELLDEPLTVVERPDARELPALRDAIRLEDVTFSYSGEQRALDHVSLELPARQMVAVVGPSGSGKSTLVNLVMRFFEPDSGAVTLDGVDIKEGTLQSLRSQVGVVFQESFLFNASIRDNIRLGHLGATDDDVERAARTAEIHDFVSSLPFGYDTLVGERGGRLSGGQRQRLALARALVREPTVLVLDEPTSALDPSTEASIAGTLQRVADGRTVIWVTHRLSTIVDADRIVVMEGGKVAAAGTHPELLSAGGVYARLWSQQEGVAVRA